MLKIKLNWLLAGVCITGLTACGGGGGSSDGGAASISLSSTLAMSSMSSSTVSSTQSSVLNLAPGVQIQFPRKDALPLIGYSNIEVSGVAYDDKGIKSVKVNGVAAALNIYPAVAQSKGVPATHSVSTTWHASINLLPGDNPINIEVTDSDGLVVENAAAPLVVRNAYTPMGRINDKVNDRMIGSILSGVNVATNLETLTSITLPISNYGVGETLNNEATEIYLAKVVDGFLKVYSSKISTGIDSLVANYNLNFDVEKHLWVDVLSGTLSSDSKFYFATVRHVFHSPIDGRNYITKLLKIDIDSGSVSVLTAPDVNSPFQNVSSLFYADDYLFGFYMDDYLNSRLIKIDSETGARTEYLSVPKFELFELNNDRTVLYGVTYDKFVAINLADKVVDTRPFAVQGIEFDISQLAYLLVDEKRNRLIVSNTGVREIIAIDITSGERSLLISNGIGEGVNLVWPYQLEVTADDKFAYVFDGRLMATDALFKIDLSTGNRTAISDFSALNNSGASGLALDEPNNRVFFATGLTIGIVDLPTGSQEIIASQEVGLGVAMETFGVIDEIVYDSENARLLVSSSTQGFVMAIDVVTYKRTVLLDSFSGSGAELKGIAGMAMNGKDKKLYISNSNGDDTVSILTIDLETGDRTLLLDKCAGRVISAARNSLKWDGKGNQLLITSDNEILVQDMVNNKCRVINAPAEDIAVLSDSTLIALSVGLSQIHPFTGARAVISR
jgi:hypothetical protein